MSLKKVKLTFIIIVAVMIIAAAALTAFMLWPSNISRQEAQSIAIEHVGGGVTNRADHDFEWFQRVWSVEVFYNGLVYEVYVNRVTGAIVGVEIGSWD